jgi:plasmid maintenance system killer protein
MIQSFRDQATEDFYHNWPTRRAARFPVNIRSTGYRKLDILNAANRLVDLSCHRVIDRRRLKVTWMVFLHSSQ